MSYNTGNPIGSTDARDLSDNAENLDVAVNGSGNVWTDRLGNARPTWNSIASYAGPAYDASTYGSLEAALTALGAGPATIQYTTSQTFTSNKTIPAGVELMPLNGAVINHGAYTISYAGSTKRWPSAQVFNGTGDVTGLAESMPDWFAANAVPGTTDMCSAIIKAIKAAKKVSFKPGVIYFQSSQIAASGTTGRTLIGNGATLKTTAASDFSQIYLDSTNSGWDISGLKFVGAANTGSYTVGVYGVDGYQSSNNYIHDNTFDALHVAVYLRDEVGTTGNATNPTNNRVDKNRILTMVEWQTGNGGYGVLLTHAKETHVINNQMIGPIGRHGVYVSAGTRGSVITENTIYSDRAQISIYMNSAGDDITGNIISNNALYGPGTYNAYHHGIYLSGNVYRNTFVGNKIYGPGDGGIYLEVGGTWYPSYNTFIGNNIINAGSSSIQIVGGFGNQILGGTVSGGNVGNVTVNDIVVASNGAIIGHDNVISGLNILAPTNPVRYSIAFDTNTYGNVASNNKINSGATFNDIYDGGSNTVNPVNRNTQTLTDAATVVVDPRIGELASITLSQNTTFNGPAYVQKGDKITFLITQDATGGRTVAWGSAFKVSWSDAGNTANKKSSVSFICDGTYYVQVGAQVPWY
ncbi:right-handed parallel beta-helix repeat-containing protein [Geomonas nitrogeniifigens]|uniref:right-handed parallel beta-helix repeat-containing protein n=1 Tax=Geomonas diazotrophica TaxID=2843197 RepID=UPI001C2B9C72|nr:right-handed parallel beta-helix repeat-containing protein [Geomonas nitrogeniifigens]QXE85962.1 right-handed parallel beta-helix repeat-containing protein [Geomonas nitrogeniifigens]